MKIYNNILETIGNTPMVKLNVITKGIKATILAKVETTNPGNSVKDRMAVKMVEDAEKSGILKPGGTILKVLQVIQGWDWHWLQFRKDTN